MGPLLSNQTLKITCAMLCAAIILSACATSEEIAAGNAQRAAAKAKLIGSVAPSEPNLLVSRLSGPKLLSSYISVDGERVARLHDREFVALRLEPGPHTIKLSFATLSMLSGEKQKIEIIDGQAFAFDATVGMTGGTVGGPYGGTNTSKGYLTQVDYGTTQRLLITCCVKVDKTSLDKKN